MLVVPCTLLTCGFLIPPRIHAQILDGKLPKIFNRDRNNDTGRNSNGGRGGGPEITFVRDFGIPKPRPVKLETIKGHEVTFFISAETKTPGMTVEFLVRGFPTAGKLVSLISNPDNRSSARVTYYADPNSAATMDSFTFAARYPGGKYSPVTRCDIKIRDASSVINITKSADFGKVLVGERVEREIVIRNIGKLPFERTIQLFSPWKMIKPADGKISLPSGGQTHVRIAFLPVIDGPATYQLALSRSDQGTCTLQGEAVVPFAINKEEWELALNPSTGRRETNVFVKNNTERPVEVFLRTSSRLQTNIKDSMMLIPGKDNPIKVFLEKSDVAAFDGGLQLKLRNGYSQMTSVFCSVRPGELHLEVPGQIGNEIINFGKVTAGRSTERGVILQNKGGELLAFDVSVPEPFRLLSSADSQLAPLARKPISIGFYPAESDRGKADQMAVFRTANQEFKVRLVGNALRPPNAPRPVPEYRRKLQAPDSPPDSSPVTAAVRDPDLIRPPGSSPQSSLSNASSNQPPNRPMSAMRQFDEDQAVYTMSPFGTFTRSIIKREYASDLKSPEDFELLSAGPRRLEVGWTAPKNSDLDTFELEMRGERINPETGMVESVWAPYPKVDYNRVGRLVKANINGLNPVTKYEFRVFTKDMNGRFSQASNAFGTQTTRTMDWTYIYMAMGLVLLGLLIWGIIVSIKQRRTEVYRSPFLQD